MGGGWTFASTVDTIGAVCIGACAAFWGGVVASYESPVALCTLLICALIMVPFATAALLLMLLGILCCVPVVCVGVGVALLPILIRRIAHTALGSKQGLVEWLRKRAHVPFEWVRHVRQWAHESPLVALSLGGVVLLFSPILILFLGIGLFWTILLAPIAIPLALYLFSSPPEVFLLSHSAHFPHMPHPALHIYHRHLCLEAFVLTLGPFPPHVTPHSLHIHHRHLLFLVRRRSSWRPCQCCGRRGIGGGRSGRLSSLISTRPLTRVQNRQRRRRVCRARGGRCGGRLCEICEIRRWQMESAQMESPQMESPQLESPQRRRFARGRGIESRRRSHLGSRRTFRLSSSLMWRRSSWSKWTSTPPSTLRTSRMLGRPSSGHSRDESSRSRGSGWREREREKGWMRRGGNRSR